MISAPRFIAIDDDEAHLRAITTAMHALGAPTYGIHYKPEEDFDRRHFRGVRVLFLDLHLSGGGASTDKTQHFALLASLLENNIAKDGGPFIVVLWTRFPDEARALEDHLGKYLVDENTHARPISVIHLDKRNYLDLSGGGEVKDSEALLHALEGGLQANKPLAALMNWETEVLAASGSTLAALIGLVPREAHGGDELPKAIDGVLSRLASEAVGATNVQADPRSAINSVLAPILADRIVNAATDANALTLWREALTRFEETPPPKIVTPGAINRMLHLATPSAETIQSVDWGAVSYLSDAELPEWSKVELGISWSDLQDEFKLDAEDAEHYWAALVRIGASCDHAQPKPGPLPLVFGMLVSTKAEKSYPIRRKRKPTPAVWTSPVLQLQDHDFYLLVHARLQLAWTRENFGMVQPAFRLRESLQATVIDHVARYASRPGIVAVR